MEALLAALVSKYGFEIAARMLGLDKQTENPKYAISLAGNTFDLGNMAKRAALNTGINTVFSGNLSGMMGPLAFMGGALALGRAFDPTRPGSRNYNPRLAGQIKDLNRRGMLNSQGQIISGPLAGKNLISMFGTNDYEKMLDKKVDYFEDRIKAGKNYSKEKYKETKQAQQEEKGSGITTVDGDFYTGADAGFEISNNNKNNNGGGSKGSGGFSSSERGASLHGAKGGLARYYRGGIASL